MKTFLFLKKCNNFYAGEGKEWYKIIAQTDDYLIANIINNSIPKRSDKESIVCVLQTNFNDLVQYYGFSYDFTHKFDEKLDIC